MCIYIYIYIYIHIGVHGAAQPVPRDLRGQASGLPNFHGADPGGHRERYTYIYIYIYI